MSTLAPSPASLAIRPADATEIPALRALAERIWRTSYAAMLTPEQMDYMLGWMYAPETIAREIAGGVIWESAWLSVVQASCLPGEDVVQASCLRPHEERIGFHSCTFEGDRLKLNKLYVHPEQQGLGFGQQLLQRVHALAAARSAREVWLQVNKQNTRALRAYQRAGYAVERAAVFEIGGGFVMDDFILVRAIRATDASST